ncbi:vitamin K epoxide reductase family protein [Nocardioides sp. R-C-SC26]|uniref:vitamin K epoxide reductase family protein n=1 Tax=Nocardioides sp. R-C-SC26 TaxID=2870414 RepID=UPI001E42D6E8|nr:vitamin K epoxide reductase family protein [Nocardioides sp. R-C-SC26]
MTETGADVTFDAGDTASPEPAPIRSQLSTSSATGVAYVAAGAVGLAAALTLAIDKYKILADPSFRPACDLNPVLSCGSVMITDQAEAFGFPNPLIGIAGFAIVVAMGVLLAARVPLPTWVHAGLAMGSMLGAVFVHWLAYQSLYEIGALCPWCLGVWAVTLFLAVWTVLGLARRRGGWGERLWDVRYLILLTWYLVIATAILERFWDYWRTLW